jgi:hypothetical protein
MYALSACQRGPFISRRRNLIQDPWGQDTGLRHKQFIEQIGGTSEFLRELLNGHNDSFRWRSGLRGTLPLPSARPAGGSAHVGLHLSGPTETVETPIFNRDVLIRFVVVYFLRFQGGGNAF